MASRSTAKNLLLALGTAAALSACGGGADRVASPGEGAFPPAPAPAPGPAPSPAPSPNPPPASDCPDGFADVGTVAGQTNCRVPGAILEDLTIPYVEGVLYSINGYTRVGEDVGGDASSPDPTQRSATLTIEPGVTVFGSSGQDALVVNRGSRLVAEGKADRPIVLTSRQSVEGTTNLDSIGQWGGLVLLGRAPIANCTGSVAPGSADCEAEVEGVSGAYYGGNDPNDSTGVLRYVRVMHSGFEVLPDVELNGITLAGLGDGTTVEYVQVHNSSDDGFEWFGGTVNSRYLVATGNDDDSFDTDTGFTGAVQFGLVVQRGQKAASGDRGDRMAEQSAAGSTALPANPKMVNVTFVGSPAHDTGIVANSGTHIEYYNAVVTGAAACLDIDDAGTRGTFESVFFSCDAPFADDADGVAAGFFNAGSNNVADGTSTLTDVFVNGANESAVPAADLSDVNARVGGFLQQVDYIGAVKDANDTWWQGGWACGLPGTPSC
ncbi:hypothetical protein [Novilysobacter defluvii]|uniref:Lipoprotein n=1 Tax=Lysobacter defluvii IMMIB APB-9 = DSM 18482 TaxID=1385515 RepID=A0A0A0M6A9_9GAMM|nr:hypothetical protein [Lysobacter defluvii]KGO98518.1 hypothetical protein N791_01575 [Lysobacter defluvii IMMIB APB-9 = DSM 18482]